MKTIITFSFILFYTASVAQTDPLHLKKISEEEINLKVYDPYPNAPAVILYNIGQMYFDLNPNGQNLFLFQKKHVRIKILNEEGLKYAKLKFLFNDMNCEQLSGELSYNFKAFTHNISETGELISKRIKIKNILFKDSSECIKIAEVTFPDVKVGSIIEYILVVPTLNLIKPEPWYFEQELPVMYSEFVAFVPDEFKYLFSVMNNNIDIKDSSYYDKVINYKYVSGRNAYNTQITLSGKSYRFVNKNNPILNNIHNAQKINIHLKYAISNQSELGWQKLSRALMITTWDDYESRTPGQRKLLPYPPAYYIYYLPEWREWNERLKKSELFGQALMKFWDCDSIIKSLDILELDDEMKALKIYNTVRENMKWNGKYSIFADVSDGTMKKIIGKLGANVNYNNVGIYFNNGTGNSAQINFVLMYLLKKAKLNVFPVLINTNDNDPVDVNISDITQFKSVIAQVEINGKDIFLDAADPESSFQSISNKFDHNQMLLIDDENFGWIKQK